MTLEVLDLVSIGASPQNEDRAGHTGSFAWVLDGATDVVEHPLTTWPSDAAWLAATLDAELRSATRQFRRPLADLPSHLAECAASAFQIAATRVPRHRGEHPSAAGLIVKSEAASLSYVSLGDCTLIAQTRTGIVRVGQDDDEAGDAWVRNALVSLQKASPEAPQSAHRAALWPQLRQARERMNIVGGYAVFSITAPPSSLVVSGSIALDHEDMFLIASDGLMRLVDIFRRYTAAELITAASERGLTALVDELRQLEANDSECLRYPRAKVSDDATGLLARYVAD